MRPLAATVKVATAAPLRARHRWGSSTRMPTRVVSGSPAMIDSGSGGRLAVTTAVGELAQ